MRLSAAAAHRSTAVGALVAARFAGVAASTLLGPLCIGSDSGTVVESSVAALVAFQRALAAVASVAFALALFLFRSDPPPTAARALVRS